MQLHFQVHTCRLDTSCNDQTPGISKKLYEQKYNLNNEGGREIEGDSMGGLMAEYKI